MNIGSSRLMRANIPQIIAAPNSTGDPSVTGQAPSLTGPVISTSATPIGTGDFAPNGTPEFSVQNEPTVTIAPETEAEKAIKEFLDKYKKGQINGGAFTELITKLSTAGIEPTITKTEHLTYIEFDFKDKHYSFRTNDKVEVPNTSDNSVADEEEINSEIEKSHTLDDLKNAYEQIFLRSSYTLDDLKNTYKFTDQDINTFFEIQNDKYVIKQSAVKDCFGRENITTVSQLLVAMIKDGFSEGYVRGAYGFSQEQADKYLTLINENPKKYVINQNAVKADFPDKEINTLGQLKEAIAKGVTSTTTTETKKVSGYYYGELQGKYGFSAIQISLFFLENNTGGYDMNQTAINDFYGEQYQVNSIERLKEWIDKFPLGTKGAQIIANAYMQALINGDSKWGFDKLDPQPTEKEIQSFYWQLVHLDDKGNMSFKDYDNLIIQNLPRIKNSIQLERFNTMLAGDELNIQVSGRELIEYINKYAELVKNELNSYDDYHNGYLCKYTKDYIENVINFAISELGDYESSLGKFNVKEILSKLESNIHLLTSDSNSVPYILTQYNVCNQNSSSGVLSIINKWKNSDNIKEKYFAKMFTDFFAKTELDEEEQEQYLRKLARELYPEYMQYNQFDTEIEDEYGFLNVIKLLQTNTMPELFTKLQRDADNVKHMEQSEIDNATSINDFTSIFGNNSSIDANYIFEHLDEMLLSDDPGVRKFAQQIYKLSLKPIYWHYEEDGSGSGYSSLEDFYIDYPDAEPTIEYSSNSYTKKETLDIIKHLIETINYNNGVTDNKIKLSFDTVKELNTNNLFDTIESAINSQMFRNACIINCDGIVDGFKQGDTNDCWFLASLISLNSTSSGQALIKNAISWADDYSSVTVSFTYGTVTLTADEIINAVQQHKSKGKYASGDMDVLIFELAYEKLGGNLDGTPTAGQWVSAIGTLSPSKLFHKSKDTAGLFTNLTGTYDDNAGGLDDIGALITGGKVDLDKDNVKKFLRKLYNASQQGKSFVATFGLFTDGRETFTWKCVGGGTGSCELKKTGHMFAITGITARTVTFVNPHNSSESFTVTWDEFANMHVAMVSCSYF